MSNSSNTGWLCRHCNNLVDSNLNSCPHCHADRPVESTESLPEGINNNVEYDNYANATPRTRGKYIFREAVLANTADISLILGIFCTFASLIAPLIVDFNITAPMLWAICIAILIFATTMVSWALLKSIAEISRHLRQREEHRE